MSSKIRVSTTRIFPASPEKIFDTLLDPIKAGKFMFATETGKMIRAEIEAKVGGKFVFIERRPDGDAEHYGTYLKIERPRRIAFNFSADKNATTGDLVSIDILSHEHGSKVVLVHEIDKKYKAVEDQVIEGWAGILNGLALNL